MIVALDCEDAVGTGSLSAASGTISPGYSVGHLDIDGDVDLSGSAEVVIEIDSAAAFDTINVTGIADLGGALTVEVDPSVGIGEEFTVITSGGLTGSKFDQVRTTGRSDIYLATVYEENAEGGIVKLTSLAKGDCTNDETVDERDAPGIALALRNPDLFVEEYPFANSAKEMGNVDGDDDFDFDDVLVIYDEHFSQSMTFAAFTQMLADIARVPEPSALALALAPIAIAGAARRRRRLRSRGTGIER